MWQYLWPALIALAAASPSSINPTDPLVRVIGRGLRNGTGWMFDWPNMFVVAVSNAGTVEATLSSTRWTRFRAWFHGDASNGRWAPMSSFWVAPGTRSYVIASGLFQTDLDEADSTTTIVLAKSSEADYNGGNETDWRVTLQSFSLPEGGAFVANAEPPLPGLPGHSRRLEFIGDSITAAYGIGGFAPCTARLWMQQAARSYPQLLCSAFGAECHVQAWSGRGLVENYKAEEPGTHMPEIERRTFASVVDSPEWDFASWIPQAVWINLGTNDACCGRSWPVSGYQDAYISLILNITERYRAGGAPVTIFVAFGPMSSVYEPQVKAAALAANAQGAHVVVVDQSDTFSHPGAVGCSGHPSSYGHRLMAESGADAITGALGWTPVLNVTDDSLAGSLNQWVL